MPFWRAIVGCGAQHFRVYGVAKRPYWRSVLTYKKASKMV